MAEILSQDEINALLAAIAQEEAGEEAPEAGAPAKGLAEAYPRRVVEPSRVKPYDFGRPNKLSKDQLRTLQIMHESFARGVATSLSAYLRAYVEAEVLSADAMLYEEFQRTVANPGIMAIFSIPPLEGRIVLELKPDIAFAILDRLLGGPGTLPKATRELTEIEQPVIRRVVERVMENLSPAWDHVIHLAPKLEQMELNPQFTQLVPPKEIVVVIGVELVMRNAAGRLNLCLPFEVIEPVVPKLSAHYLFTSARKEATPDESRELRRRLRSLPVPVRVILGEAEVTMQELLELQVGDYIPLDRKADAPLPVLIGSRPKFWARPGRAGAKMAVALVSAIDDEEDLR